MLLLMEIHNADLSLNNVIKEKTTSDPAMSSGTQVEYAFPVAIFSLPVPTQPVKFFIQQKFRDKMPLRIRF